MNTTTLNINGKSHAVQSEPDTPLLWVLRQDLGLTGTKFGCGMALCGACTVHLNGQAIRSCSTPLQAAAGQSVTTIEGATDRTAQAVLQAWTEIDVSQCGYCQPGQVMSAVALLRSNPRPDDKAIDSALSGNLCRCGSYPRIRKAVQLAARKLAG
ncbi:MAG: (2Fe-2S)-binding protein [Limnohabitans sp.]